MEPEPITDQAVAENSARIKANSKSPNTRISYGNVLGNFVLWLLDNRRQLIQPELLSCIGDTGRRDKDEMKRMKDIVKAWLDDYHAPPPYDLDQVTPALYIAWVSGKRKTVRRRGQEHVEQFLGANSYNTHRAAFAHLYKRYKFVIPSELQNEIGTLFSGLKRENAEAMRHARVNINYDKDALDMPAYIALMEGWQSKGTPEAIFGHCFSTLCWNLMCRANNIVDLCLDHITWENDSMVVHFSHMKTDQTAEKSRFPRHIYANPLAPSICPLLSIATFMSCTPHDQTSSKLLVGNKQYNRFGNILKKGVEEIGAVNSVLRDKDIGTHSFRKGSSTFVSSGSSCCPSSAAINNRADWKTGSMQDKYIKFNTFGDMFVGRTASGLPTDSAAFATLPPEFVNADYQYILSCIASQFHGYPASAVRLHEFCLASLVYHFDYIVRNVEPGHRLLQTPLFTSHDMHQRLSEWVQCNSFKSGSMTATGLGPFTAILESLKTVVSSVGGIMNEVATIPSKTVNGVVKELEDRAIGAGTVTYQGLQEAINRSLTDILNDRGVTANVQEQSQMEDNGEAPNVYYWGGRFRVLPQTYKMPYCTTPIALQLWVFGNRREGIPPLYRVPPCDIYDKNSRKRHSDLRFLASRVLGSNAVADIGDPGDIHRCWDGYVSSRHLTRERSAAGSRIYQHGWMTVVKDIRRRDREVNNG